MKNFFFACWLWIASKCFRVSIEQCKYEAYRFHIKLQSEAAGRLGIEDDFKFGSEEGKRVHQASTKPKVSLEHTVPKGVVLLGQSKFNPASKDEADIMADMIKHKIRQKFGNEALQE
jgi:hypothetical protein